MAWLGWAIASGCSLLLVVVLWLSNKAAKNPIVSAFNILFFCLFVSFLFAAASLFTPWLGVPYIAFVFLFIAFLIAETVFVVFFFRPTFERMKYWNDFHRKWKTNPLKGWGGATFAEFVGGVGLLVTIGVYRFYQPSQGEFWWAAQIAAIVSVMSSAAWVQRYILEGPEKEPDRETEKERAQEEADDGSVFVSWADKPRSFGNYLAKTGPTLLNSISAMLTVLAICVPVSENVQARTHGVGGGWIGIYIIWSLIFLIWFLIAFIPLLKSFLSRWPVYTSGGGVWRDRNNLGAFLYPTAGFAFASLVFLIIWIFSPNGTWGSDWAWWFGFIPALLFVFSFFWKWFAGEAYDTWVSVIKDIFLLVGGSVIIVQQGVSTWGEQAVLEVEPYSSIILFTLILMGVFAVIGVINGAYSWSKKPPYETTTFRSGIPTEVEMTSIERVHARTI